MNFFGTKPVQQTEPGAQAENAELAASRTDSQSGTVIGRDIVITGRLQGEGSVQIGGTVEGDVKIQGHLTVTATGKIKGPVEADVIRVGGIIEGNVVCRDHLHLERTGKIEGDVTTGTFVIENGGQLNGRTVMTGTPQTQREPSATEAPAFGDFGDLKFGRNYKGDDGEEEES